MPLPWRWFTIPRGLPCANERGSTRVKVCSSLAVPAAVGFAAIQLAKAMGAKVLAGVSNPAKAPLLVKPVG